ncbi:MAG: fumarate hydratase, partial [Firmicutes bacterium]|nr:fumarate hydratase [Bacillota bacterium]
MIMRQLSVKKITKAIKEMAIETNCSLTADVRDRIFEAEKSEPFPVAKNILGMIHENILIAGENEMPLCQDTGM